MQADSSAQASASGTAYSGDRWTALLTAADAPSYGAAWLEILVGKLSGLRLASVLHRASATEFRPLAHWPAAQDPSRLAAVVNASLARREMAEASDAPAATEQLAFPVEAGDAVVAVVAFEFAAIGASARLANVREIYWACAWLRLLQANSGSGDDDAAVGAADARLAMRLLEPVQHATTVDEAALALANALAAELTAARVSVAVTTAAGARLAAIADTPWFDRRSEAATQLLAAAREAIDARRALQAGGGAGDAALQPALVALAHATQRSVAALPWPGRGAFAAAALVVEREPQLPLSPRELATLDQVGRWAGPALELLAEQDRWWTGKAALAWRRLRRRVADPRRPTLALAGALGLLALAAIVLWPVEQRITARAWVEGLHEVSLSAPFEGYVGTSLRRAGDSVKAGEVLAVLDDRQLKLDRDRWQSAAVQHERRHVDALARRDRAGAGMAQAAMDEALAQQQLAAFRLRHAELRSETDAFVVSGDLSQQIGAPVRKGQVLFRLAPAGSYRVLLRVDERDMRLVAASQPGELVLASDSGSVRRIRLLSIGAAEASDGANVFRVEAALDAGPAGLRPGMEGVAKVAVGSAPLASAWTRRLRQWLAVTWFRLTP